MGLSPGNNQGLVAILRCKLCATRPNWSCRHPTRGYLLRVDLARPKRTPTLAQEEALDPAPESISPTRASAAARATASSASSCAPVASPRNNWPKLSVDKIKRSPHSGSTSTRLSPPQDIPAEWRIG
ncbi:hypothetical protein [Streptomyces sp. NPDC017964]|uniref:hypothetical protein n=1 Tax=Streptomyces sp. NPDC017964 TaxID=3365022 RepID=UPI0037BBD73B